MDKMKAYVFKDVGNLVYEEKPIPHVKEPDDVLLKVKAVGICGSDIHYYRTGRIGRTPARGGAQYAADAGARADDPRGRLGLVTVVPAWSPVCSTSASSAAMSSLQASSNKSRCIPDRASFLTP